MSKEPVSAMNILFFVRLQAKMLLYGQLVFDPTHVILWARSEKKNTRRFQCYNLFAQEKLPWHPIRKAT